MQQRSKKFGGSLLLPVFIAVAVVLFATAATLLLAIPLSRVLLFILYQLLAVALPGFVLAKLFQLELTPLENITAAYGLGLLVNIVVYFIFSPFYLGRLIPYAMLAVILLSAAGLFLLRGRRIGAAEDGGELKIGLGFAALMGVLTFILLSATTLAPDISGARGYYHDLTNGAALVTSAYFGFPMEFLQMSYTPHFYHVFFYSYCAVLKHCLGFVSFEIATKFSLITIAPFFAAGFVALARRVFYKNRNIVIAGLSLLLFSYSMVYYINIDLLGFSLGLGFAVLSLLFFIKAEEIEGRVFNRCHVLSMLFMLGATGAKGPIGVIAVFGICFSLLLRFIRKQRPFLRTLTSGLLFASTFFGTYFLLYQQGAESMKLRGPSTTFGAREGLYQSMSENLPDWMRRLFANSWFTIDTQRVLVAIFIILLVYLIAFRKKPQIIVDFSFGGLLAGMVLFNMFMQYGSSEVYFLLAVYPAAWLAAIYAFIRFFNAFKKRGKIILAAAAVLVFAPILYLEAESNITQLAPQFKTAVTRSRFSDSLVWTDEQIALLGDSERANTITPLEYEGLLWIRDNTPEDAVVIEGRHLIHNKFFYGTMFSERRFFLEGWGYVTMEDSNDNTFEHAEREKYVKSMYLNEDEGFAPVLAKFGVHYAIVYEDQNPGGRLSESVGTLVFENEHIRIYDIRAEREK